AQQLEKIQEIQQRYDNCENEKKQYQSEYQKLENQYNQFIFETNRLKQNHLQEINTKDSFIQELQMKLPQKDQELSTRIQRILENCKIEKEQLNTIANSRENQLREQY